MAAQPPARARSAFPAALLATALLLASGCANHTPLPLRLIYRDAPLPPQQVLRDLPYRSGPGADPQKHRLDLFLPGPDTPEGWPVLIFVHGGGWTSGDRGLRFVGADIYGNIGRFFAARGVGTAVISYRLQPEVGWREQVADVADAAAWVYEHIAAFGGERNALFLAGHSAGAQLATRVAFDDEARRAAGLPRECICGLVPVSGSAFDLEDPRGLGPSLEYYAARFSEDVDGDGQGDGARPDWQRDASIVPLIDGDAPPALVLWALGDWPALRHQSRRLAQELREHGAEVRELQVPLVEHYGIVGALSRDDRAAAPAILAFVREQRCRGDGGEAVATGGARH